MGRTTYNGRACIEQLNFFGSDHSPVVLEFELYWIARYEANQRCLQAIRDIELRDLHQDAKVLLLQHVELLLAIPLLSVFGPQLSLKLADPRLLCSDLFISSENSSLNFLLKLDGLNHNLIWCFLRITAIPGIDGWSCGKQLLSTVARCLVLFLECHSTY